MNKRQQQFVREYISNGCTSATDACRKAGYAEVARRSFLLLQNPLVKAKIDQYKKRLDSKAILSANETLIQISVEANDSDNPPRDRIRALELMAKYHGSVDPEGGNRQARGIRSADR